MGTQEENAVDAVIEEFDGLLSMGQFAKCAARLDKCNVVKLPFSVMLAMLAMTFAVKNRPEIAAARKRFYKRVASCIVKRQLAGLE